MILCLLQIADMSELLAEYERKLQISRSNLSNMANSKDTVTDAVTDIVTDVVMDVKGPDSKLSAILNGTG